MEFVTTVLEILGIFLLLCIIGVVLLIVAAFIDECKKEDKSNKEWEIFSGKHKDTDIEHRYCFFKEYYIAKYGEEPYMPAEVQNYYWSEIKKS